jgi:hypothetical protein
VEFQIAEGMRRELGQEAIVDAVGVESDPERGQLLITIDFRRRTDLEPRNLEIVL